jgi:DNA-binding protein HU-beta
MPYEAEKVNSSLFLGYFEAPCSLVIRAICEGKLTPFPGLLSCVPTREWLRLRNMAKALTKSQITASLAEIVGITKKQATQTLEAIVALAYKKAKNAFTLPGLGKLVLVNRKARMGRNPATGQSIKIPAKKVVKFRVAKAAKDAILGAKGK